MTAATRQRRSLVRIPVPLRTAGMAVSSLILLAVLVAAAFGPAIAPHDPYALLLSPNQSPSSAAWFGTDGLGRDVLSRLIAGTRYTVGVALGATTIAVLFGVLVGALAGYFGGWIDVVLSRITEMFLTVPSLFFAILLVAFIGTQWWVVAIVLGATMWPATARLTRAEVLALRDRAFVEAARIAGVGAPRVIVQHVLPNGIAPVIANASLQMAEAVLLTAGLSFIGIGDPSAISWGKMIQEGQATFPTTWWLILMPALALVLLLFSLHTFADSLTKLLRVGGRA